jgi:hypothetical protein
MISKKNPYLIHISFIYFLDYLKFSFSPSSSSNDSQQTNESNNNVNDPICKICFSKQTRFQISFTEAIRLCTNSQVCLNKFKTKLNFYIHFILKVLNI